MPQESNQSTLKRRSQHPMKATAPKKRHLSPEMTLRRTILTLPSEIMLLIINQLSLQWKTSLSLTCKHFAELTYRSTLPRLEGEELAEFLSMLQKEIPNMFYCHCCRKLSPFDPNLGWESQTHATIHGSCSSRFYWLPHSCTAGHALLPEQFRRFVYNAEISFMEAHLVMSRHFHGPSRGIPLQSMERHESFEDIVEFGNRCANHPGAALWDKDATRSKARNTTQLPGDSCSALQQKKNTWRFFFRTIPKIINNELCIARIFTMNGPLVSIESLEKLLDSMSIPICHHVSCTTYPPCDQHKYLSYCPTVRPMRPAIRTSRLADKLYPEQGTCCLCSTDYRISLDRGISDNETNLNISIYHCLGSCQSPNDDLWRYFADPAPVLRIGSPICSLKYGRGTAQRKWNEAA
ncbi:hypothetical protein ACQKWADRAFT_214570 [Trichoderma austrokoningii]